MQMPLDDLRKLSDDTLLLMFAGGDEYAAGALNARLTPVVLAHAYRLLGDRAEAEDIAQEAMLKLWRVAPEWRMGEAKVTTWLYRVVANACTDRLRKRRTIDIDSVAEPEDGAPSAADRIQDRSRAEALQEALGQLPDRQRQAVVLRHIEGLSNPEIAQIMDLKVEAVESLTARGKRALKAVLEGRKDELGYDDD
ncbi:RNA polymerase sigma factor [Lentibacter sp. XHP0401]|uniref:RNA polymerase sigma factor n=1 Tax=Lentibacter sp. XHP0401 TaxID=2984334 RepID=UPI0021E85011|nr:RNA polymerase sigma factor [Lentibacter sp. XHP0401]MCV2893007.1 RNA polymerase sigma factor [Lentibacter sp. XHP0401]